MSSKDTESSSEAKQEATHTSVDNNMDADDDQKKAESGFIHSDTSNNLKVDEMEAAWDVKNDIGVAKGQNLMKHGDDNNKGSKTCLLKDGTISKQQHDGLLLTSGHPAEDLTRLFEHEISPLPQRRQREESLPGAFAIVGGIQHDRSLTLPRYNSSDEIEELEEQQQQGNDELSPPPLEAAESSGVVSWAAIIVSDDSSTTADDDVELQPESHSATRDQSQSEQAPSQQQQQHPLEPSGPHNIVLLDDDQVRKDDPQTSCTSPLTQRQSILVLMLTLMLLVIIVVLIVVIVLLGTGSTEDLFSLLPPPATSTSMTPTTTPPPQLSKLEEIRQRGYLKCSYRYLPGMLFRNESTGIVSGFKSVACTAIAAAIWGPNNPDSRIEYVEGWGNPVDIDPAGTTHTMKRDTRRQNGLAFAAPYFYDGLRVLGDPFFVACLEDEGFKHVEECEDIRICVGDQSSHLAFALTVLPRRMLLPQQSHLEVITGFIEHTCNVFLYENVGEQTMQDLGMEEGRPFAVSDTIFAREPLAWTIDDGDAQWGDFVNMILQSLLVAEKEGLTRSTAKQFPTTEVFGSSYRFMFQHALQAVGNYGEIHERFLEPVMPRAPINQLNNGSTGLLYSHPIGMFSSTTADEESVLGPRLENILSRGRLRCGVRFGRPGFAVQHADTTSVGMDTDLCRAIAASLFHGNTDAVDFIQVDESSDGYRGLRDGELDVLAGATWNMENDVREPTTDLGFAFSQPYFYGYSEQEDNFCLATMQDDQDFSAYVYWVVSAIVYAEEQSIGQLSHNGMPLIPMYGKKMQRMFRDAVFGVGNYAEIYSRNVEGVIPRSGRNLLNPTQHSGPQHYPIPGMI
ncbi:extracellular solute-binding protein [Seminavis robusta]|uniref:Extracellular solute-binding protein n=1 Tax=Seminavis robusta TaxID=568900 RepID=A0A9N8HRL0_9STRA|nr:extracellular solute-binding protein [Seminavis robusta]|eukprot:Sro1084_g239490.1 extracellular solute-binding protein (850) ;mRNA; r:19959-22725